MISTKHGSKNEEIPIESQSKSDYSKKYQPILYIQLEDHLNVALLFIQKTHHLLLSEH